MDGAIPLLLHPAETEAELLIPTLNRDIRPLSQMRLKYRYVFSINHSYELDNINCSKEGTQVL